MMRRSFWLGCIITALLMLIISLAANAHPQDHNGIGRKRCLVLLVQFPDAIPPVDVNFAAALINMGYWDPMSCHFYKRNVSSPGISAWTKLRLGWITPEKVQTVWMDQPSEVVLSPLESETSETLVIKVPLPDSTYYLIEKRQPIGNFDPCLPGKGVLIMYVDDRVMECRFGKTPVKLMDANSSIPHLEGAAYDLPGKEHFRDEKNNIEIRLIEQIGYVYKIRIGKIR